QLARIARQEEAPAALRRDARRTAHGKEGATPTGQEVADARVAAPARARPIVFLRHAQRNRGPRGFGEGRKVPDPRGAARHALRPREVAHRGTVPSDSQLKAVESGAAPMPLITMVKPPVV